MKRLSKILMLVLVVALTLGCVFVIAASAADELPAGVTPTLTEFENKTYSPSGNGTWERWRWSTGFGTAGALRVVTSKDGNAYLEWTDYPGTDGDGSGGDNAMTGYASLNFNDNYSIYEMDIGTRTTLPNGFGLSWKFAAWNSTYTSVVTGSHTGSTSADVFKAVDGKLTVGGKVVPAVEGVDWNHITMIIDWRQKEVEHKLADGTTGKHISYADSVMNVYADGVLMLENYKFLGANDAGTYREVFGYMYGHGDRVGNFAGMSIAVDNWVTTKVTDAYNDAGDAYLGQLFNGEVKNLADYNGNEVKYNANGYTYPDNIVNAYVTKTTKKGVSNVGYYKTLADAIGAACAAKAEDPETTYDVYLVNDEGYMNGDAYVGLPATTVTNGLNLHTNGKLLTEPTIGGIVTGVTKTGEGAETVYAYAESADYVTFLYYTEGTIADVFEGNVDLNKYETVVAGVSPVAPEVETVYDAETDLFTVVDGWEYFDGAGNSLGTTLPEITESLYGTVIYAVVKTRTEAPAFEIGGTKYLASDFTAANVNGKTVKLLGDVKLVNTLSNVKVDLNGYTLDCGATTLVNGKGTTSFFYTSREGGKLLSTGTLHQTDGADSLYLGYSDANTKSDCRITLVVGLIAPQRDDRTYMYGCDVITTRAWTSGDSQGGALFYNAQARTKIVRIDNCNFYCAAYTHVFSAHKTGDFDAVVTNTNFYGNGQMISSLLHGGLSAMSVKLENVHTYGDFKVATASTLFQVEAGAGCSFSNYSVDAIKSVAEGYVLFPSNDKVTLADVTYVTTIGGETLTFVGGEFAVGNVVMVEPAKTVVNVYDKAYGDNGTATEVNAYVGYAPAFPAIGSYGDNVSVSVPTGNYVLYNADGEQVGTIAVGAAFTQELVDAGVVAAYPEVTKKATAFAIVGADGALDYKAADDFTAANVANKTVKLYSDLTISATIGNITIDLNGYSLTVNAMIVAAKNGEVKIYNSNAEKTPTIYVNSVLAGNAMYVKAKVGDAANYPDNRITVVAKTGFIAGGNMFSNEVTLYNVDLVNTENTGNLLGTMRGNSQYTATNCNFYVTTSCNLVYVDKSQDGAKVTLTNCNFYYQNGGTFGGAVTRESDKFQGIASMVLNNTKVYGAITPANDKWSFTIGKDCVFGAVPYADGKGTLPEGYVILPKTTTTTVSFTYTAADGKAEIFAGEYTANCAVIVEPTKSVIEVYDKAYGDGGTAQNVNAYVGYAPVFIVNNATYMVGEILYKPTNNYALYDANGVKVGTIAIGAEWTQDLVDKGVVAAYPEVEIVDAAFIIIDGEEVIYKADYEFTAANVKGKTVILLDDVTVYETLVDVTLDLAGFNLTFATAQLTSGQNCFIYNSNPETPATIYASKALGGGGTTVHIGYSDANTKAEGRITVVALVNHLNGSGGSDNSANYYNVDFVATLGGNSKNSLFGQLGSAAQVNAEKCNFYFVSYGYLAHAWASKGVTVNLTECKIYFAKDGALAGANFESSGHVYGPAYMNLVNTEVYGVVNPAAGNDWNFTIDANSTLGGTPFQAGMAGKGAVLVPIKGATAKHITFEYTLAGGQVQKFEKTLWSSGKMGTEAELEAELKALYATLYRNVSLDVNINFNLYVPVSAGLVTVNDEVADIVKINGADYYVVTYGQAAQNAYVAEYWVNVVIDGFAYKYNASLVSYVTALNNVQSTDDYVVDSKKLAQYVVYYVKTAAVNAYADAETPIDTTKIDELLKGFELTAEDKAVTGAIEDVTPITGVKAATLELGNSVGIVVKIADDFVGTITVSMDGAETVSETYEVAETDEEKLGKRYIVISNIAAFDFTNDVVITNDKGETMTYNLATYVVNKLNDAEATDALKAVASATYAYAVQAKAYNDLYGAAKTVD